MLRGNTLGYPESGQAKKCKPDFEKAILNQRKQKEKAENLLNALYGYIGESIPNGNLAEMIGELHCEIRVTDMRIERLIVEQEKESDND